MANRGLVRERSASRKTPRSGLRSKVDRATKKRRTMVLKQRKPEGPYSGEAGGVKSSIVRSQPLSRN